MRFWLLASVALLFGTQLAVTQNDIPLDLQDLEKTVGSLQNIATANNEAPPMPSFEEFENALKKKCDKNGGPGVFEKLDPARDELQDCIQSNFDFEVMQEELAKARKTGSMDEVFSKYCEKTPIIRECVKNMTDTFEPCLEKEEKATLQVFLNVTDSLTEFMCFKDGDRIAMFVAEGGFECIQEQSEGLKACLNKTMGPVSPTILSEDSLPKLIIDDEKCDQYNKMQSCVVKVLENCKDTTPANIVEALFKYVRRITPCHQYTSSRRRFTRNAPATIYRVDSAFDEVAQKYQPHCVKNGGQNALDEFSKALENVKVCQTNQLNNFTKKFTELQGLPYNYMCEDFRNGVRGCLKGLVKKIEACSPHEEKYVPTFGLAVYDSVFDFHCKDDARMLKKYIAENDICMKKVQNSTDHCFSKTKHIKSYAAEAVVTKNELCDDLHLLRSCFLEVATRECPNNNNVKEYVTGLSDAVNHPCSSCRLWATSFLFVVALIFVKLI